VARRVLLLTYAFPPMAVPEAALSVKRLGNTPDVEVDVVTIHPFREWMGRDESLDEYVSERFGRVERVDPHPLLRLLPLGRLGPLVTRPDVFRLMNQRMLERGASMLDDAHQLLVTWSQWHSIHLVGDALHRLTGLPWIAHFSDPWVDNPYVGWRGRTLRRNAELEHRVVTNASLLTVTSSHTEALFRRRYPELPDDRISIVPHAWDPSLYPASTPAREGPVVMRHLGAFYGPRTPEPLFVALSRLLQRRSDLMRDLRVELIGRTPDSMLEGAFRSLPDDLVRILPPVPYVASLELMATADLLLAVDAPADLSVFLPSKIVDYLGAARPVLAITPRGASDELVRRLGGWVADPLDTAAVERAIEAAIEGAFDARGLAFGSDGVRERYQVDRVGREFGYLIDRTVGE